MRRIFLTIALASAPVALMAQSAVDAMQLTQPDFKGTARYMSMGGAFTALGGDLTTLGQNPAGIGIYRSSEVGVTLDIDMQKSESESSAARLSAKQTKAYCNNFGYIGTARLSGVMQTFNWGASYNRIASFNRVQQAYMNPTNTSLTNYIASITDGIPSDKIDFPAGSSYNPYQDSPYDWLSILANTSNMINPRPGTGGKEYYGLYQNGTVGDADIIVRERGYVDEYNINFGGNFDNVVFWGLGFGIQDISYNRDVNYSESMEGARIYDVNTRGTTTGNAGFWLDNYKRVSGSGWNFKLGLIFKPVNELRIGVAVHTPTWYSLSESYQGFTEYSYYNPSFAQTSDNPLEGNNYSDVCSFNWQLKAPWRLMAGIAGVISNKAIISVDYECRFYPSMRVKYANYTGSGFIMGYEEDLAVTDDIKTYCRASNILRVGAEFRVTPQFSIRAGYNIDQGSINKSTLDGVYDIYTTGTDPSYSLEKTTQHICVGLGYKYKGWYIDAAFVHRDRQSILSCYTDFGDNISPKAKATDKNNSLIFSTGFKF